MTFTQQPAGASIFAGGSFTLTAATTSPTPTTYQWFLNGSPVPGAQAAEYSRSGAAQTEGGVSFRHSRGTWSTLRLPVRTPGQFDVRVRLRAELPDVVVTVHLNGVKLEDLRPGPAWTELAFGIPAGALRPGFNELAFAHSRTPRRDEPEREGKDAAVAVESIVFRRLQVPDGPR